MFVKQEQQKRIYIKNKNENIQQKLSSTTKTTPTPPKYKNSLYSPLKYKSKILNLLPLFVTYCQR